MNSDTLLTVVGCSELAPSVHNTQPWTFSAHGDVIEVRADWSRQLQVLDPNGRDLAISCGAAIEFGYLAIRALGSDCHVALLPDPNDPDLLATLAVGPSGVPDDDAKALTEAMPRRYTDRGAYDPTPVASDLINSLTSGVEHRGAWLRALDREGDRLAVIQALADAEAAEADDPSFRDELAAWIRGQTGPDGIPAAALADVAGDVVTDVPRRDFTGANRHPHPGDFDVPPRVERDTLLMLGTDSDSELDWLRAGRALGWLLLQLTIAGLSAQPLGQALDIESMRARLERQLGMVSHSQLLLRVGLGHGKPTTGRRHTVLQA
jgi:hypothetical protein